MAKPMNMLVIMSDEHNKYVAGHAGHPVVTTPALDAMAEAGTRFTAAYTPSPICVPARAAFATGQPVHRNACWDNAIAWRGQMKSWHHALRERGHHVASIGKLHFRGHAGDDDGFTETILPMHITDGTGDVTMLVRDPDDIREAGARKMLKEAGPGESSYTLYDRQVAAQAQVWLRTKGKQTSEKPWVLFVSMVAPHFPLTAPPEHYYRYYDRALPRPKLATAEERPTHPYVQTFAKRSDHYRHFRTPDDLQRCLAGYFGLVSFMDEHVGKILAALKEAGLSDTTRVVYTSDHGDNLGTRGLWGKATMYEESAGIPMIMTGPDVPHASCGTPVTLCDLSATILDAVGAGDAAKEMGLPGVSLLDLAGKPTQDRAALSEFHTYGPDGMAMIRTPRWKYVRYIGAPPQLFDMEKDPEELSDLGEDPAHAAVRAMMEGRLRELVDLDDADRRAKADQAAMIAHYGGEAAIRARERMAYTPPPTAR